MSSSNAASSATSQLQQKAQLPNPFELDDHQILSKVYLTHVNDDENYDNYDKDTLFKLVSNIISGSIQSSGSAPVLNTQVSFKPDFPALKRISCQMITTRGTAQCAHQTTMWILQRLRCFSWDAKALITLAAFSLEYGEFLHLRRVTTADQLGSSLKQLNQVQSRKVPADITDVVTFLVQVFQHIVQWETWSAMGYDTEQVHSLSDAMQEIPLVVYWAVATIVASTASLVGISSDYKLSEFKDRLSVVVIKLKDHLEKCKIQIERIDDYQRRLKDSINIKDVVGFLRLLIHGNGSSQTPQLYEGKILVKTGIEVFKQKHVLLFISGLDSIGDEILLLSSIYKRLQENPKVIKGFKKEDFKILWIPIVDIWDDVLKQQFKTLKERMKWYVLEYFSELPGLGIIRQKLNYLDNKPIVAVINPQGEIINDNAMDIIFQWRIEAFPFRKSDGEDLVKKWSWFWNLMKKVDLNIEDIERDNSSYIFIYGGNDSKWIQDFTMAIGKIKRHQNIKDVDVTIEHHQLGKNDPTRIPYFWIGIDGRKPKQNKPCQDSVDCEIQEAVKSMLCLKQDPLGWVILSRGHHVMLLGHGEPMYQTVADFEIWKDSVHEKESFDVAFKEYYDTKVKEMSARIPCAYINVDNNTSSVLATITCPNPTCGRVMEVTSVNYRCCHRDEPNSCSI